MILELPSLGAIARRSPKSQPAPNFAPQLCATVSGAGRERPQAKFRRAEQLAVRPSHPAVSLVFEVSYHICAASNDFSLARARSSRLEIAFGVAFRRPLISLWLSWSK